MSLKQPISFPRTSCPFSHELSWRGGVKAVVADILTCPHNPDKGSMFCVHHGYHGISTEQIHEFLAKIDAPQLVASMYSTFCIIAQILDTTRRLPVRGNLSNDDSGSLMESQLQLTNFQYLSYGLDIYEGEKYALKELLDFISTHLTGSPLDAQMNEQFMYLWNALHQFNATRQRLIASFIEQCKEAK